MEHHETAAAAAENPPHVLIYPFPLQSHVTSMLNLAELLCHADGGIHVTFLTPENIHHRLQSFTNIESRFSPFPRFHYEILSDKPQPSSGPPADHHQPVTAGAFEETGKYLFRDLMVSTRLQPPVTCIIADGALIYALQDAEELGIPVIFFYPTSASGFWSTFCFPQLIDAGEIPFKGNDDLDLPIQSVPGMEGYLRRRDLPSYGRVADLNQGHLQFVMVSVGQSVRAQGLIFNTFEEIEAPILSRIRTRLPNLYTVGPLHTHLKTKSAGRESTTSSSSNSLWEEDRSCIAWLDAQPPKSVIYVSFGSIKTTKKEQLMELWHGLINSGKRFVWAMRPDLVTGDGGNQILPVNGREEGSNYNIVSWAPQQEVLSHPSVGGFLTHSGWNSVLEGLVAGMPMLCWPYLADQQVNSRIVGEVWKVGIDMKDICNRVTIEKMVRELMDVRRDEFAQRANSIAELASKAIADGGSSHCNLNRLIKDIKLMSFKSQPTNPAGRATV